MSSCNVVSSRWPGVPVLLITGLMVACGPKNPPDDLVSIEVLEWAQDRFLDEDFLSAENGFQSFIIRDPLSDHSDSAQFMLAESRLNAGKEIDAADEFSRLAIGRPNSRWADDAQFGVCRAYFAASPRVTLSQEYTGRAIEECQRLLQFFPATDLRPQAEQMIRDAETKLADKSFTIGTYYFDRRFYESANVYFEKALSQQPGPELLPQLLVSLWDSYQKVGFDTEARTIANRLLTEFPESAEAGRVRDEDGGG